jgi:tRNA dimethylallyltransferase
MEKGGAERQPVVLLMGPTAAGKTALALRLADAWPFDIVSVDSAMVYRGMDIGTAKPGPALRRRYPHRLVDVAEPEEAYSAARFAAGARREISAIHGAGRLPLLVGGTFLYFRALERGLTELPAADTGVRERLSREAARLGWPALHEWLAQNDPETAAAIHPHDSQRVQRALEVLTLTGQGPAYWHRRASAAHAGWDIYRIGVNPVSRGELHARIKSRFHCMIGDGFLEEVAALRRRPGMHTGLPAVRAVGYRQLWRHLEGEYSLEEAIYRGIVATRQLAKRQVTWLRGQDLHALISGETQPNYADEVLGILQKARLRT